MPLDPSGVPSRAAIDALRTEGDFEWTTTGLVYGSAWGPIAEGSAIARRGGVLFVRIGAEKTSWSADDIILSLPAGALPSAIARIGGSFNGSSRFCRVELDGKVRADSASTGGIVGGTSYPI